MKNYKFLLKKYWVLTVFVLIVGVLILKNATPDGDVIASPPTSYDYEGSYAADEVVSSESRSIASIDDISLSAQDDSKIIKTGTLDLHVDDVREAVDAIDVLLDQWDGSITNSSVSRGDSSYDGYLTVKVNSEYFDEAMDSLKEIAVYVEYEYSNAEDVTEAYTDLEARLNNAKELEDQYLNILNSAGSMSEILEVTNAISSARYQIESYESSLTYYDNRVNYSTISLTLNEDESVSAVTENWRPFSTFKDAFSDWIVWLQDIVDKGIYILIFGWPVVIILFVLWRRKRKRK